jgi:hypothetical protein
MIAGRLSLHGPNATSDDNVVRMLDLVALNAVSA